MTPRDWAMALYGFWAGVAVFVWMLVVLEMVR